MMIHDDPRWEIDRARHLATNTNVMNIEKKRNREILPEYSSFLIFHFPFFVILSNVSAQILEYSRNISIYKIYTRSEFLRH